MEKIFQIPYVLPPMERSGYERYIGHLTRPAEVVPDDEPSATPPVARPAPPEGTLSEVPDEPPKEMPKVINRKISRLFRFSISLVSVADENI